MVPVKFARELTGFDVTHCRDLHWQRLRNGILVKSAAEEYDVLVTIDKNMSKQTDIRGLDLAVIVLDAKTNKIDHLRGFASRLTEAMKDAPKGVYTVLRLEEKA